MLDGYVLPFATPNNIVIPPAIILINNDLTDNVLNYFVRALYIDEVLDGYVFDGYVLDGYNNNINYVNLVKSENKRVLVKRSFEEVENRDLFDVVIFFKNGSFDIENNKFGPPVYNLPAKSIYWGLLFYYNDLIKKQDQKTIPKDPVIQAFNRGASRYKKEY